jgi:hypothetical protein
MGTHGGIVVDDAFVEGLFTSLSSPVGRELVEVTQLVTQTAKLFAPVGAPSKTPLGHPAGWLRSRIGWTTDPIGPLATRVSSPARTSGANPFPGESYGTHIELPRTRPRKPPPFARHTEPYLWPACKAVFEERY